MHRNITVGKISGQQKLNNKLCSYSCEFTILETHSKCVSFKRQNLLHDL